MNTISTGKTSVSVVIVIGVTFLFTACFGQGDRYHSTLLEATAIGQFPPSYRIEGLTRISDSRAYCIPTCLRMIADSAGVHETIEYVNWVTGFSYGGFYKDSFVTFMPISDTMQGIMFGAPYLGLERILYATSDRDLIIAGVKTTIATGTPVMIMYDYNALTDETFFFPHAAVLIGYTENEFLYFEPGFSDAYTPKEITHSRAPIEAMLAGMQTLQQRFTGSGGYSYMVFHPVERNTDLSAVWDRNGKELKGMTIPFINISMGAQACRKLADEIETEEIPVWGWQLVLPVWFSFGEYSRSGNADFMAARFDADKDIDAAITLFRDISTDYGKILETIRNPADGTGEYRSIIPPILRRIADREELAGSLFIDIGRDFK